MFKTKEEIIVIQAETKDPIPTRAVFWSHDKGTAKMLFKLRKDGTCQSLAEGTIVPVVLDFNSETAENGRGRHIYHAVIEDAVNGIVSIILEDNILGYQGRVDGSIYIELPDSRSLDTAGRFTFDIKRSPIDENVPELEDYYWQGFNEIMNQYHQTIAEIETESERLLNELQARILTLEEKLDDVEVRARFKTAYAWSADGTDRFTPVYPTENILLNTSKVTNLDHWKYTMALSNHPFYKNGTENMFRIDNPNPAENYVSTDWYPASPGEWTFSFKGFQNSALSNFDMYVFWRKEDPSQTGFIKLFSYDNFTVSGLTTKESLLTLPEGTEDVYIRIDNNGSKIADTTAELWFIEPVLRKGNMVGVPYTPAPSDDPINAYPTYKGISIVDSDNPSDYSWQAEDNTIAKKATLDSHTENISNPHKVTKTQIGLANVDNYSTATQAEAEAGTATNKFMTPALVFKAIAKWVQGKFVSIAGNETIGGIKDFKDGLLSNGTSVVTDQFVFKTVATANTTDFTPESSVTFQRWGQMVVANVSITNKDANFAGWKTLMQFPDGYKPNRRIGWGGTLTNNTNRAPSLSVYANDSGISVMSPSSDFPASQNCVGTIVYFTSDAWPS